MKYFLSFKDFKKVIHAFISSKLDYCIALYSGISKRNIHCLQRIQNANARLLTRSRICSSISTICDLLSPYQPDRCLRSSGRNLLVIPKSHHVAKGNQAFAVWRISDWQSQCLLSESFLRLKTFP
ncbi:hypothetical protein LDENG_00208200 [Lucifuga dentata]|nr:hypothetical protein LDENG_00208200 [Lucifuga dentata]